MAYSAVMNQIDLRSGLQWLSGALITFAIAMLPISTTLMDMSFLLAAITGLLSINRSLIKQIGAQWPAVLSLTLLLALVAAIAYTPVATHQALHILKKYSELLLALCAVPGLIYKRWRVTALYAFLGVMALLVVAVLGQAFSSWQLTAPDQAAPPTGSLFISYIHMSFLMAFFAYICGVKALLSRQWPHRMMWLAAALLAATAVLLSYGRTGYVVVLALACWLIYQLPHKRLILAALGMLFVGITMLYVASPSLQQNVSRTINNLGAYQQGQLNSSVGQRLTYASGAWRIYRQNPWLGAGTGSFSHAYSRLQPPPKLMTDDPHNEYLYLAAMLGTPGLILLLLLFAGTAYSANRLPTEDRLVVQGAVIAIAIGSLANSYLLSSPEGHFFAFWCAWAVAALACEDKRYG